MYPLSFGSATASAAAAEPFSLMALGNNGQSERGEVVDRSPTCPGKDLMAGEPVKAAHRAGCSSMHHSWKT